LQHLSSCNSLGTLLVAHASQKEGTMPLIQGGPPEWIYERTPEALKWEIVTSERPDGQTLYELRVQCGLEIMRLQFFTAEEVRKLASLLAEHGPERAQGAAAVCGRGTTA
jgi:hypothetical protein